MTCGNDDDDQGNHGSGDEFDVDMTPEPGLEREPEVEYLGIYESLDSFLRLQVELLLTEDGMWLMHCIDYDRVLDMMEGGVYRLWRDDHGRVFRRRLPHPPQPV